MPDHFLEGFRKNIVLDEIKEEMHNLINLEYEASLTPSKIKALLDEYIIGQDEIKKAIAVSLRYRYRNRIQEDNSNTKKCSNILICGKSGSGKTESVRQTSKICKSPFIKVDAVRYTEVGYQGDDVENIILSLYNKAKAEFEREFKLIFWKINTVKKYWEFFILSSLLGKNYDKSALFEYYSKKLHEVRIYKFSNSQ